MKDLFQDVNAASSPPACYAQPRFSLLVLGLFAATGTLLVAVGVFSLTAYNVSRQKKEIAVRMALGAARRDVLAASVIQRLRAARNNFPL